MFDETVYKPKNSMWLIIKQPMFPMRISRIYIYNVYLDKFKGLSQNNSGHTDESFI